MSPTKILLGQILVVFLIAGLALWAATQWAAHALGYHLSPLRGYHGKLNATSDSLFEPRVPPEAATTATYCFPSLP